MSEEERTPAPQSSQDYPLFGYLYEKDGTYGEPIELTSEAGLSTFLTLVVPPLIQEGHEVRITDVDDCMVFWAQKGQIKWPTRDLIPPQPES